MTSYSVYVESRVAESLLRLKANDRERLRKDPSTEGDYIERDDIGRPIQVLVAGRHAIVFWADHAAKEIKILDLKPAGN